MTRGSFMYRPKNEQQFQSRAGTIWYVPSKSHSRSLRQQRTSSIVQYRTRLICTASQEQVKDFFVYQQCLFYPLLLSTQHSFNVCTIYIDYVCVLKNVSSVALKYAENSSFFRFRNMLYMFHCLWLFKPFPFKSTDIFTC